MIIYGFLDSVKWKHGLLSGGKSLQIPGLCDIIPTLTGETGENPVRDRRRKAHSRLSSYPLPQNGDHAIGEIREGRGKPCQVGRSAEQDFGKNRGSDLLRNPKISFLKGEYTMKHSMNKLLSLILCAVLIAAMALSMTGCGGTKAPDPYETATITDGQILGEGSKEFTLVVVDAEGTETTATIRTDKTLVGEALLEHKLMAGDQQDMGLYVKAVNGKTYDFEKDGKYWAFYIDGEYAMTGIDATEIVPGTVYSLRAE
jgi:hypothetical protein